MQLLRKYTSNRGSALFMVISTMTALMISCMAMYFSVISSRSTQYAIFNQQQSKQSASSINDAMIAGMMDGQLSTLTDAMTKLKEGEKLSAGANGFKELGLATGKENDSDLGAYTVEIMRLPNETVGGVEKMVFDITTTSVVNGSNSVYHTIIYYEAAEAEAAPATAQVFAATGYVPNDVFLDGGKFVTDVFFDNEMTIVNAYGGKNMELWGDLSTGGSLLSHQYLIPSKTRKQTFAIRNTYTADFNGPVDFADIKEKSIVMTGGDCIIKQQGGFNNALVYTLGNWYAFGNGMDDSIHFVDGDVYLHEDISGKASNFYTNGKVYLVKGGSTVDKPIITGEVSPKGKWSSTIKDVDKNYMTVDEMIKTLDEKTATNTYYKWVINDSEPKKDKYVKELDETNKKAVHKTLKFVQSKSDSNVVPTIILKYRKGVEEGCVIDDVTSDNGNQYNNITLIIDTGEDEDNTYTIRVQPNRDFTGPGGKPDNKKEAFSWYPYSSHSTSTYMSILVKGRGSVVVDVPKGVTYQDLDSVKFMHYGWFVLGGGTEDTTKYGSLYKERYNSDGGYWESSTIYDANNIDKGVDGIKSDEGLERFIHTTCKSGEGGCGCEYKETDSTNKCPKCGGKMTVVKCTVHGTLNEYCANCKPEKKAKHEGECKNHVGREEIDKYLASHSTLKDRMEDSEGNVIYPNTNIFLISCEESANIRLSITEAGTKIKQNSFFGYIYAPYMTFKAYGENAGGGMVRLFGGMTVSDYIIDDSMSIVACWPDKMPNDLMSDECKKDAMQGVASKGWKISLKAH